VFKDLHYFTRIGDEGDDPHWIPALAEGQGIGFVDFPNPFRQLLQWKNVDTFGQLNNSIHYVI